MAASEGEEKLERCEKEARPPTAASDGMCGAHAKMSKPASSLCKSKHRGLFCLQWHDGSQVVAVLSKQLGVEEKVVKRLFLAGAWPQKGPKRASTLHSPFNHLAMPPLEGGSMGVLDLALGEVLKGFLLKSLSSRRLSMASIPPLRSKRGWHPNRGRYAPRGAGFEEATPHRLGA